METHHRWERERILNEHDERVQDELSLSFSFSSHTKSSKLKLNYCMVNITQFSIKKSKDRRSSCLRKNLLTWLREQQTRSLWTHSLVRRTSIGKEKKSLSRENERKPITDQFDRQMDLIDNRKKKKTEKTRKSFLLNLITSTNDKSIVTYLLVVFVVQ